MKQEINTAGRHDRKFLFLICVLGVVYYQRYFEYVMTQYNTTLFAMSYKYGFISRGLLGTLWKVLDLLLPLDLMTYKSVYYFNLGFTVAFYILVVMFCWSCMKRVTDSDRHNMYYMVVMLVIFLFPMFWSSEMFGRLDVYLYFLTFVGLFTILSDSAAVWLVLPIGVVAMCIHQGFVFTNANLFLVPLFYRILTSKGKKCQRYIAVFATFLVAISALFIYFEFFSHSNGEAIYDEVVTSAKALSEDGMGYNVSLIEHEILGRDVYEMEAELHVINRMEFPAFLLLHSPYFFIAVCFFRDLFHEKSVRQKWYYLAFLLGAATILPQYLLKVDFGRYAFTTYVYYIIMTLMFLMMGDEGISSALEHTKHKIKEEVPMPWVVLLYPMFLMPFFDVSISWATTTLRVIVEEIIRVLG